MLGGTAGRKPDRQANWVGMDLLRLRQACLHKHLQLTKPTFGCKPAGGAVQVKATLLGRRARLAGVALRKAVAGGRVQALPVGAAGERHAGLQAGAGEI